MTKTRHPWWHAAAVLCSIASLVLILDRIVQPMNLLLSNTHKQPQDNQAILTRTYEVFGFAPYWNINNLDMVDFGILTTLAYFDVPIQPSGDLDQNNQGYRTLYSDTAQAIFNKARSHGTNLILTVTLMDNRSIIAFLNSQEAQDKAVSQIVYETQHNNFNGVNVDVEYVGDPGIFYRDAFTQFVNRLTQAMHSADPKSKVTVSIYASAIKEPKLYDVPALSSASDGIFMMAYDFSTYSAQIAMPTSPLYGHKEGKYWYDVSTAVEDFLRIMPAEKLILGVPWYGYDYPVYEPVANSSTHRGFTYWYKQKIGRYKWVWKKGHNQIPSLVQTLAQAQNSVRSDSSEIIEYTEGWDDNAKVGWKAYKNRSGVWRLVFMEDPRSLTYKYEFAKSKRLAGIGLWALGYDQGNNQMWNLLEQSFGKTHQYALTQN